MDELKIKTEFYQNRNDIVIVQLGGYVDQTNSGSVEKVISDILKSGKKKIVFDLRDLIYMSSAGWGAFVGEIKIVRDQGGDLKLASMSPEVYEVFQMLEFFHIIQDYVTVEEAVESFPDSVLRLKKTGGVDTKSETGADGINELLKQSGVQAAVMQPDAENDLIISMDDLTPDILPVSKTEKPTEIKKVTPVAHTPVAQADVDLTKLPLNEKIKKVIANYPLINIIQIQKMLRHEKFGNTKVGLLKLYRILKELNMLSKKSRYRYYRSV